MLDVFEVAGYDPTAHGLTPAMFEPSRPGRCRQGRPAPRCLVDLEVPAPGTVCQADQKPFM